MLMMNDWADTFPLRRSPNLPLVKRAFILAGARQCAAQRGRIPNLILTDYYNRGDVSCGSDVGAVANDPRGPCCCRYRPRGIVTSAARATISALLGHA